jgi:hypothetical protein
MLILRKEGSPYFRVLKNKYEDDDYEQEPSELNGIFSFVKRNVLFLFWKIGNLLPP